MFEKHLWKSDILSRRPASLLKMSLFHRCFSNILLVKTNYLVSTSLEHWSKMGECCTFLPQFQEMHQAITSVWPTYTGNCIKRSQVIKLAIVFTNTENICIANIIIIQMTQSIKYTITNPTTYGKYLLTWRRLFNKLCNTYSIAK